MAKKRFAALVPQDAARTYGPANKYDPEYCWTVREMAQKGMFPEEWTAHLGVTMPTLFNWANAFPEFEQAMHEAWWLLRSYWTQKARESVQGVGMAPSILALILEKRFPDTWGKNPRNTHETFENRNASPDEAAIDITDPERLRSMDRDALQERIRQLEARRRQGEEK